MLTELGLSPGRRKGGAEWPLRSVLLLGASPAARGLGLQVPQVYTSAPFLGGKNKGVNITLILLVLPSPTGAV